MRTHQPLLALAVALVSTSASSAKPLSSQMRDLTPRAVINGSCISAPDTSCVSLVSICVAEVALGMVGQTALWSDRVCTAAATYAGIGPVLDAACCVGTCHDTAQMSPLDHNNIYAQMANCIHGFLILGPFVKWFYDTIAATGTQLWPESGDYVAGWWTEIATWAGLCKGYHCVESAPPSANRTLNDDDWTPDFSWPCPFDNATDCWWDYGPPTTASGPSGASNVDVATHPGVSHPQAVAIEGEGLSATFTAEIVNPSDKVFPYGHAEHEQPNVPPPIFIDGQPFDLQSNTTTDSSTFVASSGSFFDKRLAPMTVSRDALSTVALNATFNSLSRRAITSDVCRGPVDVPATLPALTYYCNLLPSICDNIRSHPDWDLTTDTMDLTRRDGVCTPEVKARFQAAGGCDLRQHNPAYWEVSCDEFPFNSCLEGGSGNAHVTRVPTREQQYQSSLQTSITNLRRIATDGRTIWKGSTGRMCHRYRLSLIDSPGQGAPPTAVGRLDSGSASFNTGPGLRFLTDRRVGNFPLPFLVDTAYPATATRLLVPGNFRPFDCSPCSDSDSDSGSSSSSDSELKLNVYPSEPEGRPTPTAPPADLAVHADAIDKRATSSCTKPSSTIPPTSTAQATAAAARAIASAAAAAAAASSALALASDATAEQVAAASVAVSAAEALGPAAAALTSSASDSAFASAVSAAAAAVEAAQDAVAAIWGFGPDVPDVISQVADQVTSASSSISSAMQSVQNNPQSNVPPAAAAAAKCFKAGSLGFLKIDGPYFTEGDHKAPASLVDVGSDAYFGLEIPTTRALVSIPGCPAGVYTQSGTAPLGPDFQVDCSTMELGSYWNGVKQTCYRYDVGAGVFRIFCGNNIASIYSCLQGLGLYGNLGPALLSWATS
ncbi:hypothetical protein BV20DRAFT_1039936 [Pilatotrama ljubarskyi]|nr:hypothetical protein BV20DRAFT_1039936 [Pilatotrama ljubarskyi]